MDNIGTLLIIAGLIVAVVGPIRPSLFGRKGAVPKRRDLFFMGLGGAAIGVIVFGIAVAPTKDQLETSAVPAQTPKTAEVKSEPDVSAAVDALTLAIIQKQESLGVSSAIRCTDKVLSSRNFVGCFSHSIGSRGKTALFLIALDAQGETIISPINGTAMTRIGEQTSIAKVQGGSLTVTPYQGTPIDIPAILKNFD